MDTIRQSQSTLQVLCNSCLALKGYSTSYAESAYPELATSMQCSGGSHGEA